MKLASCRFRFSIRAVSHAVAILGVTLFVCGNGVAQTLPSGVTSPVTTDEASRIPEDQLESLVASIALYPDPLLGQTLVAATYPLELIQLQQWMDKNKGLKDKALADAVSKQPWDASVQAMAGFPEVVKKLAENIQWTSDLGNAFLAQQADVMAAVQRMRAKAQGTGNLKSSEQQNVTTQTVAEGKEVIVIQQASPNVVYVPSYDPVVVYGAPAYPYPPLYYPGYVPGTGLAFGAGLVLGAVWGGGWGYGCGWGHGDVNVNINNSYVRNSNNYFGQNNHWTHNPAHRGNAPYGNRQTANQYGGAARGQGGVTGRPAGGTGTRPGGGIGIGGGAASRPSPGVGGTARPRPSQGGGANRIGGRSPSVGGGGNAFGGGGMSGNSAGAASSRGARSMSTGGQRAGGSAGPRGGGGRGRGR